jgi:hypothetical protein
VIELVIEILMVERAAYLDNKFTEHESRRAPDFMAGDGKEGHQHLMSTERPGFDKQGVWIKQIA